MMRIRYLNGNRLYHAVMAGGVAVIRDTETLNRINVFPVPDADTGTNLASTMRAIAEGAQAHLTSKATLKSIAAAALSGARGNSGLIFSQFILGMSREVGHDPRLTTRHFGEAVRRAASHARMAIVHPVEGTMITVIRDWAEAVYQMREKTADFVELMTETLKTAQESLRQTTEKLQVLAKAGVVDAGAKGFVDFLEGILHFIRSGRISREEKAEFAPVIEVLQTPAKDKSLEYRYCTEALLTGRSLDPESIRGLVGRHGDSAVVAGAEDRVRIHVHTNDPAELVFRVRDLGTIVQVKVDDMRRQYEAAHARRTPIGLLTDSSSDLPAAVLDERQIHVIPFTLSFGDQQYLDRITITPDRFYQLLRTHPAHPKTAQPGYQSVLQTVTYLAGHYESLIILTISDKLTGFYGQCRAAAEELTGEEDLGRQLEVHLRRGGPSPRPRLGNGAGRSAPRRHRRRSGALGPEDQAPRRRQHDEILRSRGAGRPGQGTPRPDPSRQARHHLEPRGQGDRRREILQPGQQHGQDPQGLRTVRRGERAVELRRRPRPRSRPGRGLRPGARQAVRPTPALHQRRRSRHRRPRRGRHGRRRPPGD